MSESPSYLLKETPPPFGAADILEFPVWNGQLPHHSRMPTDEWLAYCRSNLPRLHVRPGAAQARCQHGINVEFVIVVI